MSACLGQVDFPGGHFITVTCHFLLPDGQSVPTKLKKSKVGLDQGKQNLRVACPKGKLELKVFFKPCSWEQNWLICQMQLTVILNLPLLTALNC